MRDRTPWSAFSALQTQAPHLPTPPIGRLLIYGAQSARWVHGVRREESDQQYGHPSHASCITLGLTILRARKENISAFQWLPLADVGDSNSMRRSREWSGMLQRIQFSNTSWATGIRPADIEGKVGESFFCRHRLGYTELSSSRSISSSSRWKASSPISLLERSCRAAVTASIRRPIGPSEADCDITTSGRASDACSSTRMACARGDTFPSRAAIAAI